MDKVIKNVSFQYKSFQKKIIVYKLDIIMRIFKEMPKNKNKCKIYFGQ